MLVSLFWSSQPRSAPRTRTGVSRHASVARPDRPPHCPRARAAAHTDSRHGSGRLLLRAIARDENLSRERVRQIVAQSLNEPEGGTRLDHARVQLARLEPALQLAARGGADGELRAIDRLLRVLDRLDKYGAVAEAPQPYDENARERLLTKLNQMAERIKAARTAQQVGAASPDDAADKAAEEKDLENGDSGLPGL